MVVHDEKRMLSSSCGGPVNFFSSCSSIINQVYGFGPVQMDTCEGSTTADDPVFRMQTGTTRTPASAVGADSSSSTAVRGNAAPAAAASAVVSSEEVYLALLERLWDLEEFLLKHKELKDKDGEFIVQGGKFTKFGVGKLMEVFHLLSDRDQEASLDWKPPNIGIRAVMIERSPPGSNLDSSEHKDGAGGEEPHKDIGENSPDRSGPEWVFQSFVLIDMDQGVPLVDAQRFFPVVGNGDAPHISRISFFDGNKNPFTGGTRPYSRPRGPKADMSVVSSKLGWLDLSSCSVLQQHIS